MTNREFFKAIIEADISEEIRAHAEAELEKLNQRNAARASRPSKAQKENEPLKEKIMELLSEKMELFTASQVAEQLEISTQKASALLRQLAESGKLIVSDVKIPKKGKQKGYTVSQ